MGEYKLTRKIKPKNEDTNTSIAESIKFRNFFPNHPQGKILYKDEILIQQIYDIIIATANSDSSLAQKLLFRVSSDKYLQLAKLDIKRDGGTNYDYLSLLLSSLVKYKNSVGGLQTQINQGKRQVSSIDFIYPGMPVRVCGMVQRSADILGSEIRLSLDEFSATILLNKEHSLNRNVKFLRSKFLFALGVIVSIEREVCIRAGALFL